MAHIVLGLATSHSPQLSTPPEHWDVLVQDDMRRLHKLIGKDGQTYSYDELLARADSCLAKELEPSVWQARYDACQHAIDHLAETLDEVRPDVIVTVGDDQDEVLHEDNMPAFSVYWGDSLLVSPKRFVGAPAYYEWSSWSYGEVEQAYPVRSEMARHIIVSLSEHNFDVASSHKQSDGKGVGHAFGFVQQRIMRCRPIPTIPITINTFYPPNQPTPGRCYDFGTALRSAIESWPDDLRVCVVASGGLSHFVVDTELDERLLTALKEKDRATLAALPRESLQSGTSEARNWIATGAAVEHLNMRVIDYVPCIRSAAGTGCAMAFAEWRS